ncbi:hypothetical protein WJ0W_004036 [Paenibacillus melissococcoides]|uniref:Uncharacterized protein n=1 Tax=Paenibacillus melissococcoides TaxID=2912268 RepID=A0ABM9G4V1_9BACL|nr:hypothetical protein [Paenibacillus melissococcoides]MEB9894405.1 hypothetical protein [Bacillus cereus]CAH8246803.1 hypothetical protein WJ0W_004036 [Paenibacillus melissococcoides]CAH8715803.1 hypothetical protein HTL2_004406 [Paenibacillus melissococcoides]CAH8716759.1 hypothetical protein WDD9_004673 [Paenibacillus melissococcoides]
MAKGIITLFAAVISCYLMFLYPLGASYQQQERLDYTLAYSSVTGFVDAVRDKGFITPVMVNELNGQLARTGHVFDIEMEHGIKKYNPVHMDPADAGTFQARFEVYYDFHYTDDLNRVLFPNTAAPLTDPGRVYYLKAGDMFRVVVKNVNQTNGALIRSFLTRSLPDDLARISIPYGGMVRNEDY